MTEQHYVTRDGGVISPPLPSSSEAFGWLLRHQSSSVDHALKHEGYGFATGEEFSAGPVLVRVLDDGEGPQPWYADGIVYRYRVTVWERENAIPSHVTQAWGSLHDRERAEKNRDGIAAMVLDELRMAANDPPEFLSLAMETDELAAAALDPESEQGRRLTRLREMVAAGEAMEARRIFDDPAVVAVLDAESFAVPTEA